MLGIAFAQLRYIRLGLVIVSGVLIPVCLSVYCTSFMLYIAGMLKLSRVFQSPLAKLSRVVMLNLDCILTDTYSCATETPYFVYINYHMEGW